MISLLKNWRGVIQIGRKRYDAAGASGLTQEAFHGKVRILLYPHPENAIQRNPVQSKTIYKIRVKAYMLKKSNPDFDFMEKWNNNVPMPVDIMQGTKEKETPGMIYMKLRGVGNKDVLWEGWIIKSAILEETEV